MWIDKASYAVKVKVQAVQNHLSPPVVLERGDPDLHPKLGGSPSLSLFSHLKSRQIMLVAGRNMLVEREVAFSNLQDRRRRLRGLANCLTLH